ncbi:MAG: hypothetical protein UU73_C0001G0314 [Candidatus Daviesbacteria bacterium GW2011_GWA1_41_61]|uniref:PT repeat-containing protein n=1 Tax=Candidatus Daviesbacteria bacterium GW2011_GWA2_40_9 TaxID=1618424 RepID=A0A0G0U094_9BACT|nr:MAG: hypothetical protein UU26_C0029G0024 [Candidatus Daviesbacteria bacterium GW2011_GWC1_40_9]KKR82508.1 MAG: hypothetical protein UU29_C0012G0046 [Candidatus Daviesbacteria bacterium GW2011_GWA2_40_9]KKR93133.1 MAG: hypothetical protein UU44_C0004G0315 [Candidatus Daviesbacteria bacterium GW2011_GWB1_41_15]KKS15677.1 MAG: hypothetical protein UU73_C0001G0314 [Candidatus Daviesbacteria bacterium GW2011_GWA1_41_61]
MNFFNNLSTLQKSLAVSILSIILFISSAGASYSVFFKTIQGTPIADNSPLPGPSTALVEDEKEPRTEECPLNGTMRTQKARENWEKRFPLAVMIENSTEARPQSGLSSADIIYEAVAEGGITRFMVIYLCNLSDVQIGPVRSARTYFLDWLSEYDGLYAHVGGANTPGPANALGQIIKYKIKDLNQFSIGFPTFWRDYQRLGRPVATEHTMYSTTQKLWAIGAKKGWVVENTEDQLSQWFTPWEFKNDSLATTTDATLTSLASKAEVEFWQGKGDYSVSWSYDQTCNCYQRANGGVAHLDLNNNQQLAAKIVVVQFQRESRANDGYEGNLHLLYKTIGSGKALIFQDGKVTEGKWEKTSRVARSKYTDLRGKEIAFNRGLIWIQTVPEGAKVSY